MNAEIISLLKEYGLSDVELRVFLHLVGKGRLTAYSIAKDTGIHRSTCYDVLHRLVAKGFVSFLEDEKKEYFGNDLSAVLGRLRSKESIITSLIPQINHLLYEGDTVIRHAKTKGSFAEFNNKLFELAKRGKLSFVYVIGDSPELTTPSSRIFISRMLSELKNNPFLKKIDSRGIWDKKFKTSTFVKQFATLGQHKFVKALPNKVSLFIYDGCIAYVYLSKEDNFIEIQDENISEEMKAYFNFIWDIAST